jgi:ribosome-associated heat shock protein Hsp15
MTAADELDHDDAPQAAGTQRIDKWLWFARIIKSRTLAAQLVVEGKVRINRVKATKPSQSVRAGDVLTLTLRGRVDILRVLAPGERRGPPEEARRLYEVLSPEGTGNPQHKLRGTGSKSEPRSS